jgi:hypothetical protein
MQIRKLVPQQPLEESELQIQVINLIGEFSESLDGIVDQALLSWAEQTNTPANVFMRDILAQTIYSTFLGVMDNLRVHQLTAEHAQDFFRISAEPNSPDAKDPEPLNP